MRKVLVVAAALLAAAAVAAAGYVVLGPHEVDARLIGYDAATGRVIWSTTLHGSGVFITDSAIEARYRLRAGDGCAFVFSALTLDATTGRVERTVAQSRSRPADFGFAAGAMRMQYHYDPLDAGVTGVDPVSGKVLWTRHSRGSSAPSPTGVWSAGYAVLAIGGDNSFADTAASSYDVVDVATGKTAWSMGGAWTRLDPSVSFAAGNGVLYERRAGSLTAHDLATGAQRWTKAVPPGPGPLAASAAYVAVGAGHRVSVLGADGLLSWSKDVAGASQLGVDGTTVVVGVQGRQAHGCR